MIDYNVRDRRFIVAMNGYTRWQVEVVSTCICDAVDRGHNKPRAEQFRERMTSLALLNGCQADARG